MNEKTLIKEVKNIKTINDTNQFKDEYKPIDEEVEVTFNDKKDKFDEFNSTNKNSLEDNSKVIEKDQENIKNEGLKENNPITDFKSIEIIDEQLKRMNRSLIIKETNKNIFCNEKENNSSKNINNEESKINSNTEHSIDNYCYDKNNLENNIDNLNITNNNNNFSLLDINLDQINFHPDLKDFNEKHKNKIEKCINTKFNLEDGFNTAKPIKKCLRRKAYYIPSLDQNSYDIKPENIDLYFNNFNNLNNYEKWKIDQIANIEVNETFKNEKSVDFNNNTNKNRKNENENDLFLRDKNSEIDNKNNILIEIEKFNYDDKNIQSFLNHLKETKNKGNSDRINSKKIIKEEHISYGSKYINQNTLNYGNAHNCEFEKINNLNSNENEIRFIKVFIKINLIK